MNLSKNALWVAAGLAVLFAAGLAVVMLSRNAALSGIGPSDPERLILGQRVYEANCAVCHGAALQGQANWRQRRADGRLPAPPHDASGHTWHHPDEQLFAITKFGPAALAGGSYESDMPAYDGLLSDAEIWAVLSYIKSRWPPAIQARHDQITQASRQ